MKRLLGFIGQGAAYALFALAVGYLSTSPAYTHLEPGMAVIKLSFSHAGEHAQACRRLSQEELDMLPPNMRRPTVCPRERIALTVELEVDGEIIYHDSLPPSGLAGDGASTAYRKFPLSAGTHRIVARLRERRDTTEGFDHEKAAVLELVPRQNLVIDFRPELGGFLFL